MKEAVELEREFICEALSVDLIGGWRWFWLAAAVGGWQLLCLFLQLSARPWSHQPALNPLPNNSQPHPSTPQA